MKFRKVAKVRRPVNTALVLSGGGAKGAYQVGVIKELLKRKVKIDLVIGSSIGAFNGALLAEFINAGFNYEQISTRLEEIWLGVDHILAFNWSGLLKNILHPLEISSIYSNKVIKRLIKKYLPKNRKFHHYTCCQLSVTGSNLDNKDLEVFDFNSEVLVIDAILASMAYPVAFPVIEIDNYHYIDGGVLDNAPLKEAILWGASCIYLAFLTPLPVIEGKEQKSDVFLNYSAVDVVEELVDLAASRLMYGDLKKAEKINYLLRLINKYQNALPEGFLKELIKLYGLKHGDGKRVIKIIKLAPDSLLDPPGLMGFDQKELLKELIIKGQQDTCRYLDRV